MNRSFFGIKTSNNGGVMSAKSLGMTTSRSEMNVIDGSNDDINSKAQVVPELIAGSEDKLQILRKLVNSKNAKESLKLAGSRRKNLESMGNTADIVFAKFMKRK
jgi:hypothetical protein